MKCKSAYHGKESCDLNVGANVALHLCPKCGCQIEKDGGCPHMNCAICGHSWCWTCGFPEKHWFHTVLFGGILCQLFNTFTFGFELKIHWIFRLIITVLAIGLGPAIFMIGVIIGFPVWIFDDWEYKGLNAVLCCFKCPKNIILACFFWLPFFLI